MDNDERIEALRQELVRVSEVIDRELMIEENGLGYALVVFPHGANEPGTTAFVARGRNDDIATAIALVSHLLEQGEGEERGGGEGGDDDGETVH